MKHLKTLALRTLSTLVWGLSALGSSLAAEPVAPAPASLIITYHVAPAARPAFRRELETTGVQQFQAWKNVGMLSTYRLLFSRYADSDNWDAMALLTFPSVAEAERWRGVERESPAGLTQGALAMTRTIQTTAVSMARGKAAAETPTNPVYLVIPYANLVSASDYLKYADGYMAPQFDGLIDESVLSRYELFVATFSAGRPWSSMVILEYRNNDALARRDTAEGSVRSRLSARPEWKAFSDTKKSIREEKQLVIADQISLR